MKLWDKGHDVDGEIIEFTVGNDYLLDLKLVTYDCEASKAHAKMLGKIGVLTKDELDKLVFGLNEIKELNKNGKFVIKVADEDCHTAIENYLTNKYGDVGKKIHTARSRNDQVLTALRLYEKTELSKIKELISEFKESLQMVIKKYGSVQIPGYTHQQKAIPTTVGIWLGSFKESISDNLVLVNSCLQLIDQSPLGTGASHGIPVLELDRKLSSDLMGFSKVMENPMHAHLSRGKFESTIIHSLGQIIFDLNKLASDLVMFNMKEFGFGSLPEKLCTGSSIMPQKKNPDVLELIRADYHVVIAEEMKVKGIIGNLISGYSRDLQLTKEPVIKSIEVTKNCLRMMSIVLSELVINKVKCEKAISGEMNATEEANTLVKEGVAFRDAYKEIGKKYCN